MTARRVLVTGGAGFVGSHLVDALLARGHEVRILDNLDPQVHGSGQRAPAWVPREAELVVGDVRDPEAVRRALRGVARVYHLAAAVGVGQSMYRIADYTAVNTLGTAHLLQALVDDRGEVERVVVASSMSIYGEGRSRRPDGAEPVVSTRPVDQLRARQWELRDPDGTVLEPAPTDEGKPLDPTSIYALTKADQEKMTLQVGAAYGIPAVALRFFNIYGPRQALSNPYTGVAAIFSARLLNGQRPLIYEDGLQRRDFVSVHDVVQSLLLAAEEDAAVGKALNVGSGSPVTVRQVADTLARVLGVEVEPEVTGTYRVGDVRHCYADVSLAREVLSYEPRVGFEAGMRELVGWLQEQEKPESAVERHAAELAARGLTL
ncbi:MAG TPA: NAD-dependent epimerase/dehydratase family protein [Longimicrobiaceae bacterium]|nr:NAD-dependent epimerase/dehydratase family protein [Longimicrobiaceae bacterium]